MEETRLSQQFTSLLFCFRYDGGAWQELHAPVTKQNGKAAEMWLLDKVQPYHLKSHTAAMLTGSEGGGSIGRIYTLNDSVRRELGLPEARTETSFFLRARETPLAVRLPWVRMILFSTGVGALEFGFFCAGTAEDAVEMNYFLSEVKSEKNFLQFQRRLGKDEAETVSVHLLELMARLTAPLGKVEDFDSGEGLRYVDNKPLVFSYLLFERFPDDLGQLLFHLRTNFKTSYQVPRREFELESASGLYHPFDNLWWGTSLNGVVCCASLTGDEAGDRFFAETFPHNLRDTYLQLYLLRLHQRFAIQDFQERFTQSDKGLDSDDAAAVRRACDDITALQERAAVFKLKCLYQDPATVEHINGFDRFLAENMRIEESFTALEQGLSQLRELSRVTKERVEEKEKDAKKLENLRREALIYIVTAVWSVIIFFDSAWDLAERFVGHDIWFDSLWILLPAVAALAPAVKLAVELHKKNKDIRKLSREKKKTAEKQ